MALYNQFFLKQKMMRTVLQTLMVVLLFSIYFFGLRVLALTVLNVVAAAATEYVYEKKFNKKTKISEAVLVSAMLYTMTLPVSIPFWISVVGIVFGIFFGKMVFGGFGKNIFNPAIVARTFIYINFPEPMTIQWNQATQLGSLPGGFGRWIGESIDTVATATPMLMFRNAGERLPLGDLLLGNVSGVIGESMKVVILLCAVYLIYKKVASYQIMLGSVIGFCALSLIFGAANVESVADPIYGMLSGGFIFGTVFMATDPISAAKTPAGKWIFGGLIGMITVIIRGFALFSGGMMFAILIANTFAPIIDYAINNLKKKKKQKEAKLA